MFLIVVFPDLVGVLHNCFPNVFYVTGKISTPSVRFRVCMIILPATIFAKNPRIRMKKICSYQGKALNILTALKIVLNNFCKLNIGKALSSRLTISKSKFAI